MKAISEGGIVDELRRGPARVVIWGLGYIGLTTAHELLGKGIPVIGIDNDDARVRQIEESTITLHRTLPGLRLDFTDYIASGQMSVATRLPPSSAGALVHFVCVPTELDGTPDDSALRDVFDRIGSPPADGCIVVESTISPSWLDRAYLAGGRLCLAPRRDWFHSAQHTVQTLARVVAASDNATQRVAQEVLSLTSGNVISSEDMRAVAFGKAFENSLWLLMAAYTNYLSQEFAEINMREVIRLSQTNWRTPFDLYPGFRVGGYCLPLSIEYIAEAHARGNFPFAEAVRALNDASIGQLVDRLLEDGSKEVLVLGLSYRPEVRVHTNSAGLLLAQALVDRGVECRVHDPLYSPAEIGAITGAKAGVFPEDLLACDAVVLCVAHAEYESFDPRAFLAAHGQGELGLYDGTGIWDAASAADQGPFRYFNLGTPSWVGS